MSNLGHNLASEVLEISYRIAREDFLGLYLWQQMDDPVKKESFLMIKLWLPIALALAGILFFSSEEPLLGAVCLISSIGFMLVGFNRPTATRKRVEALVDGNFLDLIQELHTVSLSKNLLVSDTEHVRLELNPSKLLEILEVDHHFYVKSKRGIFIIIAKRVTDDIDGLRNRLRSYNTPFRSLRFDSLA